MLRSLGFTRFFLLVFLSALLFFTLTNETLTANMTSFLAGIGFAIVLIALLAVVVDALGEHTLQARLKQPRTGKPDAYPANIHPARIARMLGLVPDAFTRLANGAYRFELIGGNMGDLISIRNGLKDHAGKRPNEGTTPLYDRIAFDAYESKRGVYAFNFYLYWDAEPDLKRLVLSEAPIIGKAVILTPPPGLSGQVSSGGLDNEFKEVVH